MIKCTHTRPDISDINDIMHVELKIRSFHILVFVDIKISTILLSLYSCLKQEGGHKCTRLMFVSLKLSSTKKKSINNTHNNTLLSTKKKNRNNTHNTQSRVFATHLYPFVVSAWYYLNSREAVSHTPACELNSSVN